MSGISLLLSDRNKRKGKGIEGGKTEKRYGGRGGGEQQRHRRKETGY